MVFLPASVIDGARTNAEALRRHLYAATAGRTGVIRPGDLKVAPLGTPGPAVLIGPGAAAIESTFPGGGGQSYSVANDATVQVPIPANTGGATTYRVCVKVRDPQYPGMPTPGNPLTDTYTDVHISAGLPTDRPYILLGNIPMAANATNALTVNDARDLAVPRELTVSVPFFPATNQNMSKGSYTAWAGVPQTVFIPPWTTYILAEAHINGIEYTGTDNATAGVRMLMNASVDTQNGIVGSRGKTRQAGFVVGRWNLVAGAGTNAQFSVQANQTAGTGLFQLDYQAQVMFRITFQERVI